MAMHRGTPTHNLWTGLRQTLTHGVITVLAVAIAFSLPGIANYILNEWWPEVQNNANLLLATEVALASVLALLFNLAKIAWDHRRGVLTARLASLIYARNAQAGRGLLGSHWNEEVAVIQADEQTRRTQALFRVSWSPSKTIS